jgi:hypothetical protein
MTNFRYAHIDALAANLIEMADIKSLHPSFGHERESRLEMIRERFDKALLFSFPLQAWEKMTEDDKCGDAPMSAEHTPTRWT